MPTPSSRLNIQKPSTSDDFDTSELADNWQIIDDHPGVFICTSGTRPTWGAAHNGMLIFETDTDLYWRWDGSAFVRAWPLGRVGGSKRTTDISVASTTPSVIVSVVVNVPTGGRHVAIQASWGELENPNGVTKMSISRDGVQIYGWNEQNDPSLDDGPGGSVVFYEQPGEGVYTYALRFANISGVGGTSSLRASGTSPTSIDVIEA